jgi:hypothetical protein
MSVTVFTLTPASAAQSLRDNGLGALGLTMPRLSRAWDTGSPSFDAATLRLIPGGNARAPFAGTLEYLDDGNPFRGIDGEPIAGPVAALRLHPQAVARLDRLFARFAAGGQPHHRAVPETLVLTGAAADRSLRTFEPGEDLGHADPMSFHDARGLIIDPVALAALFVDLVGALPALDQTIGAPPPGGGDVASIAALAAGILVQLTDLHGVPFVPILPGVAVERRSNGGSPLGDPGPDGLLTLAAGDMLGGAGAGAAERLRLGLATGGVMGPGPLAIPVPPVALARQFLRVFVTDLDWHLRGNRTQGELAGVPRDDGAMPADLVPAVRDGVTIDYLADGPEVLAEAGRVLRRLDGAGPGALGFAVAPVIEDGVRVPDGLGAAARWPQYPGPDPMTTLPAGAMPLAGAKAEWMAGEDVVLTLLAGSLPAGTHVRIYPQCFQLVESIGPQPSFVHGDGGAALAIAGQPLAIRIANPLGLGAGDPKPSPATLVFDMVVTPRAGRRRFFAARTLPIGAGPAPAPPDPFAPAMDLMAALPDSMKSICPVPLFGRPRTAAPAGSSSDPVDIVTALAVETAPREGPRMPTMARLESIVVTGLADGTVTAGNSWDGVLSGAAWSRETMSAALASGNPGNPAGPDRYSAGVRANGALAYDLARHAVRRVQPLLPLPANPPVAAQPGWIAFSGGDNMNPPDPLGAPGAPGTAAGVLLQSIAALTETPLLALLPPDNPLASETPIAFDDLIDDIADALGVPSPAGAITVANEDRLVGELRREYFLARSGARDALWSLARAFTEAEELVFIETPSFAVTARPDGIPESHEIELFATLAARLAVRRRLKVVICCARETDLVPAPFRLRAIAQRAEALGLLEALGEGRIAAFHPRGFPGRPARIDTTTIIVDDVYALTGATHLRRRGLTFDGSAAIASLDRTIEGGYSAKVRRHRQALMASRLGVQPADAAGFPDEAFVRLSRPDSAFDLVRDLLAQGGLGRIEPIWEGPGDIGVAPQSDAVADPDGTDGHSLAELLAAFLSEA